MGVSSSKGGYVAVAFILACALCLLASLGGDAQAYAAPLSSSSLVSGGAGAVDSQSEGGDEPAQDEDSGDDHPADSQQPEEGQASDPFGVRIEHDRTADGKHAMLIAVPYGAAIGSRFECHWEVSKDGGKTWEAVDGVDGDPLVIVVSDDGVAYGYQYRVATTTAATGRDGREGVTIVTEPVTMQEGNGLAVVLSYDPPVAGQTAYFQTTLYGKDVDPKKVSYTWQQSQDGGATWTDIPGCTGSSLAVPTEPIDPNATEGGATGPITYIRVIVVEATGEGRTATSEAVPLTVHAPDETPPDEPAPATIIPDDPGPISQPADGGGSGGKTIGSDPGKVAPAEPAGQAPGAASTRINKAKVTAADVRAAAASGATTVTLGPKAKRIAKRAFAGTKVKTVVVESKKLTKKRVRSSLKGSAVKTVKVKVGKLKSTKGLKGKALKAAKKHNRKAKAANKKYVKKYRKVFAKKNSGKKVRVR